MTIKDLIKADFGVDLPISGGTGNSIDNAIIIHSSGQNDYVGTENFILYCLGKGRGVEWKFLGNELLVYGNKKIDKLKIETKETTPSEIITQTENYYFDITYCLESSVKPDTPFNEKETLDLIKKRLLVLEKQTPLNKKCIDLLRKGELLSDFKLTMDLIDVIMADESLHLFELMITHRKTPIVDVLRIMSKELY